MFFYIKKTFAISAYLFVMLFCMASFWPMALVMMVAPLWRMIFGNKQATNSATAPKQGCAHRCACQG